MSIFGRSSNRMPCARTRFGPVKLKGEARSDQVGSVNMLRPWVCTSTVAWPTHVATICGPSIWRAGTVGATGICPGQTAPSRPRTKESGRTTGRDARKERGVRYGGNPGGGEYIKNKKKHIIK